MKSPVKILNEFDRCFSPEKLDKMYNELRSAYPNVTTPDMEEQIDSKIRQDIHKAIKQFIIDYVAPSIFSGGG